LSGLRAEDSVPQAPSTAAIGLVAREVGETEDGTPDGEKGNGMNATTTATGFTGWIRRGRAPWRLFCRAATHEGCLAEMLRRAPAGADKLVRQGNADPNLDRKTR